MAKGKRLTDLYVKGAELEVGDEQDTVKVWIQKPSPVQHEAIMRTANAARAREASKYKNKDSEDYLAMLDEISELWDTREAMVPYLIELEIGKLRSRVESELELTEDSEWGKDSYLQGLRDSWFGGLSDSYHLDNDPNQEEAMRVFDELKKFSDESEEILDSHRESLQKDYDQMDEEKIENLVIEKHFEHKGTQAWFSDYRRAQVLFSTRDINDHASLYFSGMDEVNSLALPVLKALIDKIEEITVEPAEGKD